MKLEYNHGTHAYSVDGRVQPSCTQVLRAEGIYSDFNFATPIHRFRGSAVHEGAAIIDMGGSPRIRSIDAATKQIADDIINGYWPAFRRWKERTKFQGYCWECPIICTDLGYGVTFDVAGLFGSSPEVILAEVKSGELPEMVPMQLASQFVAIKTGHPVNQEHPGWQWVMESVRNGVPVRRVAVKLSKDGSERMYSETKNGDKYDDRMWELAWRSVCNAYHLKANYGLLPSTMESMSCFSRRWTNAERRPNQGKGAKHHDSETQRWRRDQDLV